MGREEDWAAICKEIKGINVKGKRERERGEGRKCSKKNQFTRITRAQLKSGI
jgi:hypothetical protein